MALSPQFLDEIRNRISVSDVVARRVKLARRGREFVGLSPFNKEKTPSFTVNDEKGFFHCFSSGEHGDIFAFLMKTEGLSFPESVEKLAAEVGLEVPQADPASQMREKRRASLQEIMEQAADWYSGELFKPGSKVALEYLRGRGLDEQTIKKFRLGYAPSGRGLLTQALGTGGITVDEMVACGLARKDEGGGGAPRDYFFSRIIFPITDRRGKVIAFGGRTMGSGQPKYLNSPETDLFHKGSVLYGVAQARGPARDAGSVIVAEGYMDVIALAQGGFTHSVAPLGTALTEAQIQELWRLADEPVLCFDGDKAGVRAAGRAALRALPLLKPGKSLAFALLPEGEDPDSMIVTRGPEALARVISRARPLVDVIWSLEVSAGKFDTPERQAALKRDLRTRVRDIADEEVGEFYRLAFDQRLERMFPRPDRYRGGSARGKGRWTPNGRQKPKKFGGFGSGMSGGSIGGLGQTHGDFDGLAERQEQALLALMIHHPSLVSGLTEIFAEIRLTSVRLDRMMREILNLLGSEPNLDSEGVRRHLIAIGNADLERLVQVVLSPSVYSTASFARPDAGEEEAERALHDILDWYGRRQVDLDRQDAERDLAADMTEAKEDRLFGILREQIKEDGLYSK